MPDNSYNLFLSGRLGCHTTNTEAKRLQYGAFNTIMAEAALSNVACYRQFTRMTPAQFVLLHQRVGPLIRRGSRVGPSQLVSNFGILIKTIVP